MKPATTRDEVLDEILLGLADEFEAGNPHWRTLEPSCPEEFEPLRECIADMIAEGWDVLIVLVPLYSIGVDRTI